MLQVAPVDDFSSVEDAWQRLLPLCAKSTVFITPCWQKTWWDLMGGDQELLLLAVSQGDEIKGVAPLVRSQGAIAFLGNTDLFDYHDFIVPSGQEGPFLEALVEYLSKEKWDTLDLPSLPQSSPTLALLPELAKRQGYVVDVTQEDVTPGLALQGDWEQYLSSLSKKDRHELRRKLRRLGEAGQYRLRVVTSDSPSLEEDMDQFLRLLTISREDKLRFLTPEREKFFRAVARRMKDSLRLFFLEMDGQQMAATMCFDYGSTRLLYNSGYDTQYTALSAGLLLKAMCIKDAIEKGFKYFDFLRGAEQYKYHLGGQDVPLYHMVVRRPP